MNDTWQLILQLAGLVLALIGGKYSVPAIQWLKGYLGLSGTSAQALTAVVAFGLGLATLVIQGVIAPETLTAENAVALVIAVLTASQAEYQRIIKGGAKAS